MTALPSAPRRSVTAATVPRTPLARRALALAACAVLVVAGLALVANEASAKVINCPTCGSGGGGTDSLAITSLGALPATVELTKSTTISVTASGGTTPYTYSYTGAPTGCAGGDVASFTCTPTETGTFSITVHVEDAKDSVVSSTLGLIVTAPTITSFTASPNPVLSGGTTTISAAVSGGNPPYTYTFTGMPSGCTEPSASSVSSFSCVLSTSQGALMTYDAKVTVKDADGLTTTGALPVVVGSLSLRSFTASNDPALVNEPLTISAVVSGAAGLVTYSFSDLPTGCTAPSQAVTSAFTCTPSAVGVFSAQVEVTDAQSASGAPTEYDGGVLVINVVSSISTTGSALAAQVLVTDGTQAACGSTIGMSNGMAGACDNDAGTFTGNAGDQLIIEITPSGGSPDYSGWWELIASPEIGYDEVAIGGAHSFSGDGGTLSIPGYTLYPGVNAIEVGINDSEGGQVALTELVPLTGDVPASELAEFSCPPFPSEASGWAGFSLYFPECSVSAVEGTFDALSVIDSLSEVLGMALSAATFGISDLVALMATVIITSYEVAIDTYYDQGHGWSFEFGWPDPVPVPVGGEPSSSFTSWGI